MENGGSGGSDALTPETVLAAEGPPLEALGARGGRGAGSCEKDMGLDGAGGAELAPDGDVEALRRLERTLGENRVPTAYGAPLRGREDLAGSSGLPLPGVPGGGNPTLMPNLPWCVSALEAALKRGVDQLGALIGVLPPNKVHAPIASPSSDDMIIVTTKPCLSAIDAGSPALAALLMHAYSKSSLKSSSSAFSWVVSV